MLTAINSKIILAALITIGALVYAFRQQVEKDKKKHSSAPANEGKTWQKYIT